MRRIHVFLLLSITLLIGCEPSEKSSLGKNLEEKGSPFLFRMNLFFGEAENNMSFPVWFEKSIVSSHKIFHISRKIFHISMNSEEENQKEDLDLRELRDYYFNRIGLLDSVRIRYYYDDHEIGNVSFIYSAPIDQIGFCSDVRVATNEWSSIPSEMSYRLFNKIDGSNKHATYVDRSNGQKIHYVFNKKHWGPLSVDSIVKPKKEDLIVLGIPSKPFKKYSVMNKVHESNVILYTYFLNSDIIHTISRTEYPFDLKRDILYSKSRETIGYVDSTFSDKNYLTRTVTNISKGKYNLPNELKRLKENQGNKTSIVSIEKFEYEIYP